MAWYPEATKKVIKPGPNDPPIIAVGAILHVDAGNSPDLFKYFSEQSDGIESHFHVPKAGPVIQMRDTHFEADANLKANSFYAAGRRYGFVSIETQGFGAGEWNSHQLDQIRRLLVWLSETHNFPLKKCDNPQGPGVGYHTLFGAPGPWTPRAKTCPGPDRVRQFNNLLVPWMASTTGGLDLITDDDVNRIADAVYSKLEPRLKAYAADVKKYEAQTDAADAERAAQATVKALKAIPTDPKAGK